jgi:hypothetical protein
MIELRNDFLDFRFPGIHPAARLTISFQRTLRIPDDNRPYYLPPGLGYFPLKHVDDYAENVPSMWITHGGVFLPMYQAEALWIHFANHYPFAIKIAAGKINAVTGDPWRNELPPSGVGIGSQDYVVAPDQPWLDGFSISRGLIRQFVAMPLGEGYTAEEQLTGDAEHGGLQIIAYPMKAERYGDLQRSRARELDDVKACYSFSPGSEMGLAPGGLMRQEIYRDRYGLDAWETDASSRCFVHILNSRQYQAVTGEAPPTEPVSAEDYTKAGLPWFDYYAEDLEALSGAAKLANLDSVAAKGAKKDGKPLSENEPVAPTKVIKLGQTPKAVRDGQF